jgi:hypothetical protein
MPRRMSRLKKWLLLSSLFFLLVVLLLFGLGGTPGYRLQTWILTPLFGDPIERTTRSLSGNQAIECGRVGVRGNPSKATLCSLAAQYKGLPFRVAYELQGIDSHIAEAIVRTPDSRLFRVTYDSCPQGCGFSIWFQRTYSAQCAQPQGVVVDSNGRLTCPFATPLDPSGVKHGPLLIFR